MRWKSASERVSERTSEREGFRGFQRFLEYLRGFSEVLSETLSEADFPLRGSRSCLPLFLLPLNLSPTCHFSKGFRVWGIGFVKHLVFRKYFFSPQCDGFRPSWCLLTFCFPLFVLQGRISKIMKIGHKYGSRPSREIGGQVHQKMWDFL